MPGVEAVQPLWAPAVLPLADPVDEDWVPLTDWQTIKVRGGQILENVTQAFNVGTADVRLRNGDSAGNAVLFTPTQSYKGRHIKVYDPTFLGNIFIGHIDRVEYHYDNTPFAAFVTLHCVDLVGNVADGEVPDELFPGTVEEFTQVADVETAVNLILEQVGLFVENDGDYSNQLVKAPDKFESRQSLLDFLNEVLLTESAAIYATPLGDLVTRGRWEPFTLLSATSTDPVVFTDTAPDGLATFPYRRDDLEWSDADEDAYNSVQTASKYLNNTFTAEDIVAGYPRVQLSRTELVTIRQGWVEANARMWLTLYNQARAYPKKITFMIATFGEHQPNPLSVLAVSPWPIGSQQYQVLHTPPGGTQITYRLAVDSVEHNLDRKGSWLCTFGFTSLDRWWFGYGNGTDPIELIQIDGDADHGIDSDAIIAP